MYSFTKQCILDDGSLINPDLDRRTKELSGTPYGERLVEIEQFRWTYVQKRVQELCKEGKTLEQLASEQKKTKVELLRDISAEAEKAYMEEYMRKE